MLALLLERGDDVHGLKRTRQVGSDAVEKRLSPGEAVRLLGTLHAEHSEHVIPDAQRHRDGLAGIWIDAVEALVGHAPAQHDLLPARCHPARDPLGESLAPTQTDL